jgi:dTDP-4-amino-4,6-dideoxygalactose transaminase
MLVTADTVRAALTPRTRAVIAVHLFGNVAPVAEIAALGVPVLEDAAQAAGSTSAAGRPGTLGTIATFSFFPSKNLPCLGDGGAVTTGDPELAERVRMLRLHGSRDQVTWETIGYNSRLDALQAAFLRVILPHLDGWAAGRVRAGEHYRAAGLGELVALPEPTEGTVAAWHVYVIRSDRVDEIHAALGAAGIASKVYYRPAMHHHPALTEYAPASPLSVTDHLAATHLAIPMSPLLDREQADAVTDAVASAL